MILNINKTKLFFKNVDKIDNYLARLINKRIVN